MVQFQPGGSLSAGLGAGIGQGLSSGLQLLAEQRMNQLQKNQQLITTGKALVGLGFSPEQAAALAGAAPELQKEALKQNAISNYLSRYGGEGGNQQQDGLGGLQDQGAEEQTGDGLSFLSPQGQPSQQGVTPGVSQQRRASPAQTKQQLADLQAFGGSVGQAAKAQLDVINREEEAAFKERQYSQKDRLASLKNTQKYRDAVAEEAKLAFDTKSLLDQQLALVESGNLVPSGLAAFLEAIPGSWDWILSPESQLFKKNSLTLTSKFAKDFGGRINEVEFKTFLQRVPQLYQTEEGQRLVIESINNLQAIPSIVREETLNEIIEEYESKGKPLPTNLSSLVERRVRPKLDKIADETNKRIAQGIKLTDAENQKAKRSAPFGKKEVRDFTQQKVSQETSRKPSKEIQPLREGEVVLYDPNGVARSVKKEEVQEAMDKGKYTREPLNA